MNAVSSPIIDPVLSRGQFDRLISYGSRCEVEVGDVLFTEGATDVDLIVIESASVVLSSAMPNGDERQLHEYGPGQIIGELVLLTGHGVEYTATTSGPGVIHRVSSLGFRQLLGVERALSELLLTAFMARRRLSQGDDSEPSTLEIVGAADSVTTQALRTYANRDNIRHNWLDSDGPSGRSLMSAAGLVANDLPAVVGPERTIVNATPVDLIALSGHGGGSDVDVVVIGAGAAGLTAAVHCALAGMATVVIDRTGPGGQAARSHQVLHYLGFPDGISGLDLMTRATRQARSAGARFMIPCEVLELTREESGRIRLDLSDTSALTAHAVVIASGATYPTADLPGWRDFTARGVYFAVTEAAARRVVGQSVVVAGDSGDAANAAIFLAESGCDTSLVRSGDDESATLDHATVARIARTERLTLFTTTTIAQFHGTDRLTGVTLNRGDQLIPVETTAVFSLVDPSPNAPFVRGAARDGKGFLRTGENLGHDDLSPVWTVAGRRPLPFETNVPAVFAIGDVRSGSARLARDALADGSVVSRMVARRVDGARLFGTTG